MRNLLTSSILLVSVLATEAWGQMNLGPLYSRVSRKWTIEKGVASGAVSVTASSIVVDSAGNSYVAGYSDGAMGGQPRIGGGDFFLSKYNSSGTRIWTVQDGNASASGGQIQVVGIALDSSNNVIITGTTQAPLDGQTRYGNWDIFTIKYDSAGNRLWTVEDGSPTAYITSGGLTVDTNNNIYVTGFTNHGIDGNTQKGIWDFFIIKYNSSGVRQWTVQDGVAGRITLAFAITSDSANNIYVAGQTNASFGGQSLVGANDALVIKYDSSGNRLWATQSGAAGASVCLYNIAVDAAFNVYATGSTDTALYGQTLLGPTDLIILKYNSTGVRQWAVQDGAAGASVAGTGLALDASNNIYVGGLTDTALHGNTLYGFEDIFISKFNSAGSRIWTIEDGGPGGFASDNSWYSGTGGTALGIDSAKNVYLFFNTDTGVDGKSLVGGQDLVLTKYDTNGARIWTTEEGANTLPGSLGNLALTTDASGNIFMTGSAPAGQSLDGMPTVTSAGAFFMAKYNSSGVKQWIIQDGATGTGSSSISNIATDSSGNCYAFGVTNSASLDGKSQINVSGSNDYFLTKYNSSGIRQWTVRDGVAGAGKSIFVGGLSIDTNNNLYILGNISGGGLDGQTQTGVKDYFISKYDTNGTRAWTVQHGVAGSYVELGSFGNTNSIATDSSGNIYITLCTGAALDGQTLHGLSDYFISKYNSSGVRQWTVQNGAPGSVVSSQGIAVDTSGFVYLTGQTMGSLDGQPYVGAGGYNSFITKYDGTGARIWTREDGVTSGSTIGSFITTDPNNNLLVIGTTTKGIDGQYQNGSTDMYITKYNSNGTRLWTQQEGSSGDNLHPYGIAIDTGGSFYVLGVTSRGLHNSLIGNWDLFLSKY